MRPAHVCCLIFALIGVNGLKIHNHNIYTLKRKIKTLKAAEQPLSLSLKNDAFSANEISSTESRRGFMKALTSLVPIVFMVPESSIAVEFVVLRASDIKGPSVSYADFLKRLDANEVESVEFMFPAGNEAYVTFKVMEGDEQKQPPIRIGEGYPIEQSKGSSSPAYVIRTVKEKGVPYKFTVPMLENYK
mmetsp:Transcript_4216/g.4935  ORF Transcript_4216/g.4935 Transcript_4216/m.4935 type:complete len:189 (-) Transcript_4216:675-1241(-)|eukprot:CAMPEP_0194416022 /NCGR_PEP_ID=MMETSP0176-20130528/14904_1 /TAXON_ID=216777 /ORGANISM="Proboscia alata, Strain PI-D3" /LENGTH=188 /DNA_ID=CAMNT_0039221057 /DNA_START=58 /DNA_END=624 /DNA_ORIENTATION=+